MNGHKLCSIPIDGLHRTPSLDDFSAGLSMLGKLKSQACLEAVLNAVLSFCPRLCKDKHRLPLQQCVVLLEKLPAESAHDLVFA